MNNGRPPYGNAPVWGQQSNQAGQPVQSGQQNVDQGGYPPRQPVYPGYAPGYPPQNAYAQQPQPTGYAPQQSYPPAAGYGTQQGGYAPQQTGYAQRPGPMGYPPQGQPGYAQPQPNGYPPQSQPNGYPQQGQPNSYAPQGQPNGYPSQQGMYPPQQGYPPQPSRQGYPQGYPQPPQQVYQNQYPPAYQPAPPSGAKPYMGYSAQGSRQKRRIDPETIGLAVIGGVLPVLFILGMVLPGVAALKWVFVVLTVVTVAYAWTRGILNKNLRITLSLVYGAMAVAALVSALLGQPLNDRQSDNSQDGPGNSLAAAAQTETLTPELTLAPVETPVSQATPDPDYMEGAARQQLESFFYFWSVNNIDNMVTLTSPSWQRSAGEPKTALFTILVNRTPVDYEITAMTGTEADTSRTATVRTTIKGYGRSEEVYLYRVVMTKEEGVWYVDPLSLTSNEPEPTETPAQNAMPTQPPMNTSAPGMTLYYNPDGGEYYHIDPECGSAARSVVPFKGSFKWEQVNDEPYASLQACAYCGAPLRGD